jgi:hypothetical protein
MVSVYDLSQYSVGRLVLRLDLINAIKTIVKNFSGFLRVFTLIDHVVGFAAERIESAGGVPHH